MTGDREWDQWRRRRQAAAVVTFASILWGLGEIAGCSTEECVDINIDRATTSLVGPSDGPPVSPVVLDVTTPAATGGPPSTFAHAGVAEGSGTAFGSTLAA